MANPSAPAKTDPQNFQLIQSGRKGELLRSLKFTLCCLVVADMVVDEVADTGADMEVDKVADMAVDKKKVTHMELDMVADM